MIDSIRDIIRENLEATSVYEATSLEGALATLLVALACAAVIYLVYRFFYRGVVYSENFNALLVMACLVTAFIIQTIATNLVLSLGMVGALSIVRFRSAIKEPLDVGFVFWSVAAGLTAGARLYPVALVGTLFIAVLYIALSFMRAGRRKYLVIVRLDPSAEDAVKAALKKYRTSLKNKTRTSQTLEMTVEIGAKGGEDAQRDIIGIDGVLDCALMEYSGDYAN
uniref:DUF4956 domain-containing protein n=1 Tax=uncultured bacterium contig00040 TaxID=1181528 RepID=A0A806KQI8_9BACT|nr:hypothetical protein [uncultured bacterium contig00040]